MELVRVALFGGLLCVLSPVAIPVPVSPVPLTLATFTVYLVGMLLGAKQGVLSVLVYLLLGMVGLPVFSGFSGGIGVLLGPTGGYLIGYLPCAWIVGGMTGKKTGQKRFFKNVAAMTLGTVVCYLFGTAWFLAVMRGSYTIGQALLVCVVPYLVFDSVKILAAGLVEKRFAKIIRNRR